MFAKTGVVTLFSFFVTIRSAVAFVVFACFYNTLDNYPVCCLHKLSIALYSLVLFMKLKPVTGKSFLTRWLCTHCVPMF